MPAGLSVFTIRLIVIGLVLGSQLYLFARMARAIRGSRLRPGWKGPAAWALGLLLLAILAPNVYWVLRRRPPAEPSPLVLFGLIYPYAIWSLGAIPTAAALLAADLGRRIDRLARPLARRGAPSGDPAACPPLADAAGCPASSRWRVGHRRTRSPDNGGPAGSPARPSGAVDVSRRRFLRAGLGTLGAAPVLLSGYGVAYGSRSRRVEEIALTLGPRPRLRRPLSLVQISDIHAGPFMSPEQMADYAEAVARLQPDLFVMTGDFIATSPSQLPACVQAMARVQPPHGSFAILGNHEHWFGDAGGIIAELEAAGIRVLHNAHAVIATDAGPLNLIGIDDLRAGAPDLPAALRGLDPALPSILLSHRPEIFPLAARAGIDLVLSGHYHGGQIKVNFLGLEVSPAHLLSPYPEGLYTLGPSTLYVNRGIGTTGTPIRLNVPPEITLFHLR